MTSPTSDLPHGAIDRAGELTRRARSATDDREAEAYRRERARLLAEHGFRARRKREDGRDALVLHPAEWIEDGRVRVDRVDDVSRGVEVVLSGTGDDDWAAIDRHNRELAAAVRREHGERHGANAAAFADFAGNHHKRVEETTAEEVREFLTEYFPRNAFPSDDQRAVVSESLSLLFEAADREPPCSP